MADNFARRAACLQALGELVPVPEDETQRHRTAAEKAHQVALESASIEADAAWLHASVNLDECLADHTRVMFEKAISNRKKGVAPSKSIEDHVVESVLRVAEIMGIDDPWDSAEELRADGSFRRLLDARAILDHHALSDVEHGLDDIIQSLDVPDRSEPSKHDHMTEPVANQQQSGFAPPTR